MGFSPIHQSDPNIPQLNDQKDDKTTYETLGEWNGKRISTAGIVKGKISDIFKGATNKLSSALTRENNEQKVQKRKAL